MVKSTAIAFFAGLVAAAQAYTVAVGENPSGNPIITPKTSGSVEAGKTFDITWTPTSGGTVTIYLCKGPSTNCVNQAVPLADKVANSGSFAWNVPTSVEASANPSEGYGIQLISDQTPSIFQWSGQFGVVNKSPSSSSESVSAASVATSSTVSSSASVSVSTSASSSAEPTVKSTSASSTSTAVIGTVTGGATGGANSTAIQPTIPMSVPSSLKTTASGSASAGASSTRASTSAVSTGAAAAVKVGAGALFGGVLAALAI